MARFCPSLLLLVATMVLVSRGIHAWGSSKVVRKFEDIPETYVYVQQALWFAMKEYNKASKDKYTFKVVQILKSQEQVTDSLDYFLEVKIARTMCKKFSGENENCLLPQDPKMQKMRNKLGLDVARTHAQVATVTNGPIHLSASMFLCTFVVASKPWKFELTVLKKQCKDI